MRLTTTPKTFRRLATVMAVLVVASVIYEQIGRRRDRERYPQIGESVDIGGRSLNIRCVGDGGPTVVFETFGHNAGLQWADAQAEVADLVRACWYDRAGYGWSDSGPRPRTYEAMATDLNKLLQASGLEPPFIFVGQGDAALHLRVYHGLFPEEVAGLVFINGNEATDNAPEIQAGLGPWRRVFGAFAPQFRSVGCAVRPLAHEIGLMRLLWQVTGSREPEGAGLSAEERERLGFLSDNPTAQASNELCSREESLAQVRAAGELGDTPLIVLASRNRYEPRAARRSREAEALNQRWIEEVQPRIASLSTNSELRIVDQVGEATLGAIRDLAERALENP